MRRLSHATFVAVAVELTAPADVRMVRRIVHTLADVAEPEAALPMYDVLPTVSERTETAPPLGVAHEPSPLKNVVAEGVPVAVMSLTLCA